MFCRDNMAKLFTLDSSLIEQIKRNMSLYSERILLGGLNLKRESKSEWLENLNDLQDQIPTSNLCIGQSDINHFKYLNCNQELSHKG